MRQKLASVVSGPSSFSLGRTNGRTLAQVSPGRDAPGASGCAQACRALRHPAKGSERRDGPGAPGDFPATFRFSADFPSAGSNFCATGEWTPMRHFCSTMVQMCAIP